MPDTKPKFNPNQEYSAVDINASTPVKPKFDPNKSFETPQEPLAPSQEFVRQKPVPTEKDVEITSLVWSNLNSDYQKRAKEELSKVVKTPEQIKELKEKYAPSTGTFDPLEPITNWAMDFVTKTGTALGEAGETFKKGVGTLLEATSDVRPSKGAGRGETLLKGGLQTATGTVGAAFNIIPAAVTFNAGVDVINTAAKKNLSEENAKTVEEATSIPFTLFTRLTDAIGLKPEEGSNQAMASELFDLILAGKVIHSTMEGKKAIKDKIKSVSDLKDMSKKAAGNQLNEQQLAEYKDYVESLKKTTAEDIKNAAIGKNTPESLEIAKKIEELQQPSVEMTEEGLPRVVPATAESLAEAERLKGESLRTVEISEDGIPRVRIPSQEEINIAYKEKSDTQSKNVFDAIKAGEADVDKMKSSLDYALKQGKLTAEEHALANQKIDTYQNYFENTKDVHLTDEAKRNVFDLTWTNENVKTQLSNIESQMRIEPNNMMLNSKQNALQDIYNENQRAIDNHLIQGIAEQMGTVSPKTQEKIIKNKITSDNEMSAEEKDWAKSPKNVQSVKAVIGEGKTHDAFKAEAKKQFWKAQPENIAKAEKMFAEGKEVSPKVFEAELERQYQEANRGAAPEIVSNVPTAEHKVLHDYLEKELPGKNFNNLADVSNSDKADIIVKHMLDNNTRTLKGGVIEVGAWAKAVDARGKQLPHYYDVDFGGKKVKFASSEHTAGMHSRNLQGRPVDVQLVLPEDANLQELVDQKIVDPHTIIEKDGVPVGFKFEGSDAIYPHVLVAREVMADGSTGPKVANLVSSDFSDYLTKKKGREATKAKPKPQPKEIQPAEPTVPKENINIEEQGLEKDIAAESEGAKVPTIEERDAGFTATEESGLQSKEEYIKEQKDALREEGDLDPSLEKSGFYDKAFGEKHELLNENKVYENDTENENFIEGLSTTDNIESEPGIKALEIAGEDAGRIEKKEIDRITNEVDSTLGKAKKQYGPGLNFQMKKAMKHDVTTAYDQVMQYFINGGKINAAAIKELFGGKGKENATKIEENLRKGYIDKAPLKKATDKAIDGLAHDLWMEQKVKETDFQEAQFDTQDFRNAIEEVITDHNTRAGMAKALNEAFSEKDTRKIDTEAAREDIAPEEPIKPSEHKLDDDAEFNITPDDGKGPSFQKAKTIVGKEIEKQIKETESELKAAKAAFESKRVELDKKIVADQEDLFGERKSTDATAMFDERVSEAERNKVIEPLKVRVDKATAKLADLQKKLKAEEGKEDLTLFQKESAMTPETQALRDKKVALLKKAIKGIEVVYDKTIGDDVAGQLDADGKTVRLNPKYNYADTPIHEFGHALIDIIGGMKNSFIKKGTDQLRNTKLWKETEARYPELSPDMLAKEVLAEAIGREGVDIFNTKEAQGKFKNWLDGIFYKIKSVLGIDKNVAKQLANKLLKGEQIAEVKAKESGEVQKAKVKPTDPYELSRQLKGEKLAKAKYNVSNTISDAKNFSRDLFEPIATTLNNIHPTLKGAVRNYQMDLKTAIDKDLSPAKDLLTKVKEIKKMSKADFSDFDFARKNGDTKKINEIVKKYGMEKEYKKMNETIEALDERAAKLDLPSNFKVDGNPVRVKDYKGLMKYVEKELGTDAQSIKEESELREAYLERPMTEEENAEFANEILRKRATKNVPYITPEMEKFYDSADDALMNYITSMNLKIATREFAGKGDAEKGFETTSGAMWKKANELLSKGEITPDQYQTVSNVITAYFNKGTASRAVTMLKNIGFIDVMGNFSSALGQISDIGFAMHKYGPLTAAKEFGKSVIGKSEIKSEDVVSEDLKSEFSEDTGTASQKAVKAIFKWAGLEKMEKLSNETIVNSHIAKMRRDAMRLDKLGKYDKKAFMDRIDGLFEPAEAKQVIKDLIAGKNNDNIKRLAYNGILDLKPIGKSEVPLKYLENPNGRSMYSLKLYTLKSIDILRNEVGKDLASKDKARIARGTKNLILLSTSLAIMGATTDEIRDYIGNKKKMSLSDRIFYSYLKTIGINSYMVGSAKREGLGTVLAKQLTPTIIFQPIKILQDVYTDIHGDAKGQHKGKTLTHLPIFGKLLYENLNEKK